MQMALFNKRPAPREVHAPIEAGSYLGQGSKVRGKLNFEGPARIDGQIDGEIIAKDSIMIGGSAVVSGPITPLANESLSPELGPDSGAYSMVARRPKGSSRTHQH